MHCFVDFRLDPRTQGALDSVQVRVLEASQIQASAIYKIDDVSFFWSLSFLFGLKDKQMWEFLSQGNNATMHLNSQNSLSDFNIQSLRLSNSTLTEAAFHQACLKWSWQSLYTNPHNVHQPRHALNKYLLHIILQYTVVYLWLTYVPRTWPELVISDSMGPKPNWDLWIPQNKALSEELLFSLMAPQGSGTIKSSPSSDCHVCPIVSWVIYATDYSSCNFNAKWICEMSDMLHNMCIIVHASYSHASSWSSLPVGSVARPELMSWNVPTLNIMLLRLHV